MMIDPTTVEITNIRSTFPEVQSIHMLEWYACFNITNVYSIYLWKYEKPHKSQVLDWGVFSTENLAAGMIVGAYVGFVG